MRKLMLLAVLALMVPVVSPASAQDGRKNDDWCRTVRGALLWDDASKAKTTLRSSRGALANINALRDYLDDAKALCDGYSAELRLNSPYRDVNTGCKIEVSTLVNQDWIDMWGSTATSDAEITISRLGNRASKPLRIYVGEMTRGTVTEAFRWVMHSSFDKGVHRVDLVHDGKSSIFVWNVDPSDEAGISLEC